MSRDRRLHALYLFAVIVLVSCLRCTSLIASATVGVRSVGSLVVPNEVQLSPRCQSFRYQCKYRPQHLALMKHELLKTRQSTSLRMGPSRNAEAIRPAFSTVATLGQAFSSVVLWPMLNFLWVCVRSVLITLAPSSLEIQMGIRLFVAAILGAVVGLERRTSHRPAGMRTMCLVAMGAATFTVVSQHGFARADQARVASSVATGVGFIGAGVITTAKKVEGTGSGATEVDSDVRGLTTASAIWITAAIGMACGTGLLFIATFGAAMTVFVLKVSRVQKTLQKEVDTLKVRLRMNLKTRKQKQDEEKAKEKANAKGQESGDNGLSRQEMLDILSQQQLQTEQMMVVLERRRGRRGEGQQGDGGRREGMGEEEEEEDEYERDFRHRLTRYSRQVEDKMRLVEVMKEDGGKAITRQGLNQNKLFGIRDLLFKAQRRTEEPGQDVRAAIGSGVGTSEMPGAGMGVRGEVAIGVIGTAEAEAERSESPQSVYPSSAVPEVDVNGRFKGGRGDRVEAGDLEVDSSMVQPGEVMRTSPWLGSMRGQNPASAEGVTMPVKVAGPKAVSEGGHAGDEGDAGVGTETWKKVEEDGEEKEEGWGSVDVQHMGGLALGMTEEGRGCSG